MFVFDFTGDQIWVEIYSIMPLNKNINRYIMRDKECFISFSIGVKNKNEPCFNIDKITNIIVGIIL